MTLDPSTRSTPIDDGPSGSGSTTKKKSKDETIKVGGGLVRLSKRHESVEVALDDDEWTNIAAQAAKASIKLRKEEEDWKVEKSAAATRRKKIRERLDDLLEKLAKRTKPATVMVQFQANLETQEFLTVVEETGEIVDRRPLTKAEFKKLSQPEFDFDASEEMPEDLAQMIADGDAAAAPEATAGYWPASKKEHPAKMPRKSVVSRDDANGAIAEGISVLGEEKAPHWRYRIDGTDKRFFIPATRLSTGEEAAN